jgi:hypothetical protein
VNLLGASVFVEPYQMVPPTRGELTSETLLDIVWEAIVADSQETGGSPIDSYNLQWREAGEPDFVDIVG